VLCVCLSKCPNIYIKQPTTRMVATFELLDKKRPNAVQMSKRVSNPPRVAKGLTHPAQLLLCIM